MVRPLIIGICCLFLSSAPFAQDEGTRIDKSKVPAEGNRIERFVPAGWKIEEQITGDLNGDSVPDHVLKLVENRPATDKDGSTAIRQRALVIVTANQTGGLKRAAVADKLLQCTFCGGAFYGMTEAPATVKIERGSVVVEEDHGSREVTNLTFRFRYDPTTGRFMLIGADLVSNDRATGNVISESTNYLTGARVTVRGKRNRTTRTRSQISKSAIAIDDFDYDQFEVEAVKRLNL